MKLHIDLYLLINNKAKSPLTSKFIEWMSKTAFCIYRVTVRSSIFVYLLSLRKHLLEISGYHTLEIFLD